MTTTNIGMLWVWGESSSSSPSYNYSSRKKHLEPILKASGVRYAFIAHENKFIPALNIDPELDVVLALGNKDTGSPLQELKNNGIIKKNITLGSSRGKIYTLPCGARCMTSYTSSVREIQYDLFVELQSDVQLALRLLTTGSLAPPMLDFKWVDDLTEVLAIIDRHHTKWNHTKLIDVAIDLETTGLVPYDPNTWVVTFQVSTDEKSARVIKFDKDFQPRKPENASNCTCREELLWLQINTLVTDQEISLKGANLKFDIGWISEKWGITVTNFKFDTLLVGSLLDENQSNSLKTHAFIYTCLSADTEVLLADGSWSPIRTLVKSKYSEKVMSWNGITLTQKNVTNWIKNKHPSKEWWGLELDGFFPAYARFTPDHKIYTKKGKVEIQHLQVGDEVISAQKDFYGDSLKVFLASVIGDGGISLEVSNARFSLYQKESNEDYLLWKTKSLGGTFNRSIQLAPEGSNNDNLITYRTSTYSVAIKKWWDTLPRIPNHKHNTPIPTRWLLEQMGALGLAIWYQDDGTFTNGNRPSIRCHCTGYEQEALTYFKELFGDDVYYASWGAFVFRNVAATKFFEYISPYAHPCFSYKYPTDVSSIYNITPEFTLLTGKVISVGLRKLRYKAQYDSYCLEVEDTHNFVTRAGVVSNCYGGYEQDIYDHYNIAEPNKIPDDVLLPYCGYDTAVCLQVARKMKAELLTPTNQRLIKFYTNILHPAARAYERVERTGVLVDHKYYLEFKKDIEGKIANNLTLAKKTMGGKIIAKWSDSKDPKATSLARAAMISDYMFGKRWLNLKPVMFTPKSTKEKPVPSTTLEHFLKFKDDPIAGPFVQILKEYKDCAKTLSTYIDGFLADLRYDKRFHATFFMHRGKEMGEEDAGTVTGRISIKNPALQCLKGNSLVLTDKGEIPIEVMVTQYEKGERYKVLTHTGKWRDVIGGYRNGVQPLLKITTESGASIECTKNHPWLTSEGFIQAGKLRINDQVWRLPNETEQNCFIAGGEIQSTDSDRGKLKEYQKHYVPMSVPVWCLENSSWFQFVKQKYAVLRLFTQRSGNYSWSEQRYETTPPLSNLASYGTKVYQLETQGLPQLRWSWNNCMSGMAGILSNVFKGYGGETRRFNLGTVGCGSGLFTPQLQMGYNWGSESKQKNECSSDYSWDNKSSRGLGETVWYQWWNPTQQVVSRVESDSGSYHSSEAEKAGFQEDYIKSIEEVPAEETFDLTIDKCHSFIVDKLIVHNTIPKKTKWSKLLRRAFIAPEKYVLFSCFPANAPVLTTNGIKPIISIKVGDNVLVDGVPHNVSFSGCTGKDKEVYRVRTRSGRYLEATGDHKLWVLRKGNLSYIDLLSLTNEDYLIQDDSQSYEGMDLISADLAYLGGLFMGDGRYAISNGGKRYPDNLKHALVFSLGKDVEELKPELQKFADMWGCKVCVSPNGDTSLNTKEGCLYFNHLFDKNGSSDTNVPEVILLGTKNIRESFLAGAFDSDGSAHSGRLTISSINEKYIQQLALLASSLGIFGIIRKTDRPTNFSPRSICYHLDIFNRDSIAKFPYGKLKRKVDKIKEMQLKAYTQCRTESIPVDALTEFNIKNSQNTVLSNRVFSNARRKGYTTRDALKKAIDSNPILDPAKKVLDYRYDKVESIEYVGKKDVYDITVDTVHCFNAYGFRVHNCDYSQGELKILADFSGEENMLYAYNNGIDLHAYTGAGLAGIDFETFMSYKDHEDPYKAKIFESKRQAAKASNFGLCLKENQKVLTKHLETGIIGLTYIQDVKLVHKLWDGLEWCNHDGVLYKGFKEVIEYDGLTATPDHKIWLETGEVCTLEEARKANIKLAVTGCETIPITFNPIKSKFNEYSSNSVKGGNSETMGSFRDLRSMQGNQVIQRGELYKKETNSSVLLSSEYKIRQQPLCENFGGKIRYYFSTLQQRYTQAVSRLQGQGYSVPLYFQRALYTLGFGNVPQYGFQEIGIRQDRQQWSLFSRQLTVSNQFGKSSKHGLQRLSNVSGSEDILDGLEKPLLRQKDSGVCSTRHDRGTDNRTCKRSDKEQVQELAGATIKIRGIGVFGTLRNYCSSIYMAGETYVRERLGKSLHPKTNEGVSFSGDEWGTDYRIRQEVNKAEAEELGNLGVPIKLCKVYDILNAGPRRRFTCEGKLVSNCYGMSADGYRAYAETGYGVKMTITEAEEQRDKFFITYPGLLPWHDRVKKLAKQQGYIDSPLGRRRHLPLLNSPDNQTRSKELRRSVNSGVQSTLSDFSLWATAIAEKEGITEVAPVVLMVHDQLVAILPEDNWKYYAKRYRDIMENLPFEQFGWEPRTKFTVDVEISMGDPKNGIPPNLANLVKPGKIDKDWDK